MFVWSFKILLCDNAEVLFTNIPILFTAIHFHKNVNSIAIYIYIRLSSIVLVSYVSDTIRSADCHRKSSHGTQFTLQYYQAHTHFIHQLYTFKLIVSTVMNNKYINIHSKFCKGPKNRRKYTHTMSKFCIMKEKSLLFR